MNLINGKIISVTSNSKFIILDRSSNKMEQIVITPFPFYEIEKITESKILVVGHGKGICIIDFHE